MKNVVLILFLIVNVGRSQAQDQPAKQLMDIYEPAVTALFGQMNPEAPKQTEQFDFLVGEFRCDDRTKQADGRWLKMSARWRAEYVLNGFAILDQYWNERYAGMSIRFFDTALDQWQVHFFGAPPLYTGRWLGDRVDDQGTMVMKQERARPDGTQVISRLTFSNIGDTGFDWVGERLIDGQSDPNWKISCKKLKADRPDS